MRYTILLRLWRLLILLCCCRAGLLEARAVQPRDGDVCYLKLHRSAIAGTRMYFMGGQHTVQGGVTNGAGTPFVYPAPPGLR